MCQILTKVIFKGLIMVGALFIIGLFTYKYFSVYVVDETKDRTVATLNAGVHCVLVSMLVWSLLATYFTDPGYVKSFFTSMKLPPSSQLPTTTHTNPLFQLSSTTDAT